MKIEPQTKLHFIGVDFVSVHLDSQGIYDEKNKIDLEIEPKIFYPEDQKSVFKIVMEVSIKSKDFFDLQILALGNFKLAENISELDRKNLTNGNAPAIMFPYVRSFIATLTANLGGFFVGNVILPTHFFKGELEEYKGQIEE